MLSKAKFISWDSPFNIWLLFQTKLVCDTQGFRAIRSVATITCLNTFSNVVFYAFFCQKWSFSKIWPHIHHTTLPNYFPLIILPFSCGFPCTLFPFISTPFASHSIFFIYYFSNICFPSIGIKLSMRTAYWLGGGGEGNNDFTGVFTYVYILQ